MFILKQKSVKIKMKQVRLFIFTCLLSIIIQVTHSQIQVKNEITNENKERKEHKTKSEFVSASKDFQLFEYQNDNLKREFKGKN